MTIYASTPSTSSARRRGKGVYVAAGSGWGREHQPNPLLIAYRRGHVLADQILHLGTSLIGSWVDETPITYTHVQHARRVVGRLVSEKENA